MIKYPHIFRKKVLTDEKDCDIMLNHKMKMQTEDSRFFI